MHKLAIMLIDTLDFALLCITSDNQLINWWKKWIDFVKIKLYSNENIKWHCMQLELNWFLIQLKLIEQLDLDSIQLKKNEV
jgi:hypothetical protein